MGPGRHHSDLRHLCVPQCAAWAGCLHLLWAKLSACHKLGMHAVGDTSEASMHASHPQAFQLLERLPSSTASPKDRRKRSLLLQWLKVGLVFTSTMV